MPAHHRLTDADREKRRADDRALVQQAVEQLRSSEGWQRWLATRRHFHTYSLRNQLLIAMQKPDATRVAGFKAWLTLGYCVRRGEKALRIFAPCPPSKTKLKAWRDAGANPRAHGSGVGVSATGPQPSGGSRQQRAVAPFRR
jgi:hypothetical protein